MLVFFFCNRETDTHSVLIAAAKQRLIFEDLNLSPPFLYTSITARILCCRNTVSEVSVLFLKFPRTLDLLITFQRDWCRTGKNGNSCSFQVWVWIWCHVRPPSSKSVLQDAAYIAMALKLKKKLFFLLILLEVEIHKPHQTINTRGFSNCDNT